MQVAMYQRESPLPLPEELRGYFDISPDVGDRILKMAEQAADHRHEMQRKTLSSSVVLVSRHANRLRNSSAAMIR